MMFSEWLALLVNLLVATYLIHYYPKSQVKAFRNVAIPRGFLILRGVAKVLGVAIILASLGYAVYRIS